MVAVAMCVSMNTGGLCVNVLLDISSLPMEQFVKVCSVEKSLQFTLVSLRGGNRFY